MYDTACMTLFASVYLTLYLWHFIYGRHYTCCVSQWLSQRLELIKEDTHLDLILLQKDSEEGALCCIGKTI